MELKIGDIIRMIDSGCCYSTYTDFFSENNIEKYLPKFEYGRSIKEGRRYEVKFLGYHRAGAQEAMAVVEDIGNKQIYLIGITDSYWRRPNYEYFKVVTMFSPDDICSAVLSIEEAPTREE